MLYPAELQTQKRVMGIEPTYPAWKAGVLPLNYTRICLANFFTISLFPTKCKHFFQKLLNFRMSRVIARNFLFPSSTPIPLASGLVLEAGRDGFIGVPWTDIRFLPRKESCGHPPAWTFPVLQLFFSNHAQFFAFFPEQFLCSPVSMNLTRVAVNPFFGLFHCRSCHITHRLPFREEAA